jgi:heparin binding hemagglutinin HbhA
MPSNTRFDLRAEAQRGLHAYVGAADLAIETVREYVADAQQRFASAQKSVQKSVRELDLQPSTLRERATARRDAVEKRVAELQADASKFVTENVDNATDTYDDLVKRGETIVRRFRNQPAAKQTAANARTTVSKAKTTATQARKTAKKSPARSSAKATGTAAKKTVKSAAKTVR